MVIDLLSRCVIGWAASDRMKKDLAIRALDMAVRLRDPSRGCIFHSDRGSQYCSHDFQKKLTECWMMPTMSGKGNCFDNAAVETFFKSLKTRLLWRQTWPTRRLSFLGNINPLAFEAKAAGAAITQAFQKATHLARRDPQKISRLSCGIRTAPRPARQPGADLDHSSAPVPCPASQTAHPWRCHTNAKTGREDISIRPKEDILIRR
ncbi:hypothetical protein AA23498_0740 [Acetobacter nitrogenifigens DSM 23921 = NBRC 105050]|uniref:Integrase catalytic domain-containing protein n=1 Tax=Acetobacter nitrogenifigens DSM 23921 = NBRC 105050 TaxID=1120919 RepID=A0A511XDC3_9PROT|nr:hypothetical protein AA23498_0740 [Acetobacter nitrogenifigens DSM 23921 = NBRC 105050]GEN60954.1 hypothetical protein ANI02nite_28380 [Acetobacter nitrogenifigens DSM 23921 = NBRC 105050]